MTILHRYVLFALMVIGIVGLPCRSANSGIILGNGNAKCYHFINEYVPSNRADATSLIYTEWVSGYLTNFNLRALATDYDITNNMGIYDVMGWLLAYCRSNLDYTLAFATMAYIIAHHH